jgi:hypothetical protein
LGGAKPKALITIDRELDNTDDHEKNHSLLVVNPFEHGRLRLRPK